MAAARRYTPEFGIATECGMARARSEATVRELPKIHAEACWGSHEVAMARNVHLVGSVPLERGGSVRTASAASAHASSACPMARPEARRLDHLARTGIRLAPAFEKSGEFFGVHAGAAGRERYTLKPGFGHSDIRFDNLFYADIAEQILRRIQAAEGYRQDRRRHEIPGRSGAGAFVIWLFLVDALHAPLDPIYNDALKREIDKSPPLSRTTNWRSSSTWPPPCLRGCSATRPAATAAARKRCRRHSPASSPISAIAYRLMSICSVTSAMAMRITGTWSSRPTWATWSSSPTVWRQSTADPARAHAGAARSHR